MVGGKYYMHDKIRINLFTSRKYVNCFLGQIPDRARNKICEMYVRYFTSNVQQEIESALKDG